MSDELVVDSLRTRLLFRMSDTEVGFRVKAVIVDETGRSLSDPRTADLDGADLPEPPDLAEESDDGVLLLDYGERLFDLLHRGDLANSWTEARRRRVGGIALDITSSRLAGVPWELLRTDNAAWAFCSTTRPAMRTQAPYVPPPPPVPVPLHVLVVVGDPGDTMLAAETEIAAIFRGVCAHPCWQVDVLRGPTQEEFHRRCGELLPQVIHFIGHGTTRGDSPALEVVVPAGGTWKLDAITVAEAFEHGDPPRLVVLNACGTAELVLPEPFARGVSAAFVDEGCAAVVSMQGDLPADLAVPFARELYRHLAGGDAVDVAVAHGRLAMKHTDDTHRAAWALPVVELAAHPADVLWHAHAVEPRDFPPYRDRDLVKVHRLVDRTADRRTIHRRLRDTGLLFVTGGEFVGKSELLRSCAMIQAFGGRSTVYVTLANLGSVSAIDFVKIIVREAKRWLRHLSDSERLCDKTLEVLPAGPGDPAPALPIGDTPQLMGMPQPVRDPVMFGYERLQGLLRSLAQQDPLTLILDEVGELDYRDAFKKGLLEPAANDVLTRVRVVLAGRRQSLADLVKDYLTTDREVRIDPFDAREAVNLAREYVARERGVQPGQWENDERRWADFEDRMVVWAERIRDDGDLLPGELEDAAKRARRRAGQR